MISDCFAERWQYRNGWKFLGQRKVQIPDAGAGRSQEQVGPSLKLVEGGKRRLNSEYPRVRAQHFIIAIKTDCMPIEGSISHVIISSVIHGTDLDRKSVVYVKSVSVRVYLGGPRIFKIKK